MAIVLGIHSSFKGTSHDSSAAVVIDGIVICAIEEERLSRRKSSVAYPPKFAVKKCLSIAGIKIQDVDLVCCDGSTFPNMAVYVKDWLRHEFGFSPEIEIIPQSDAHIWGSFFSSGLESAICFDVEGLGDGVSTKVVEIKKNRTSGGLDTKVLLKSAEKHSLGNFYTNFTQYLGFESVEGEYKVMGMAAYGESKRNFDSIINFDESSGVFRGDVTKLESKLKRSSISQSSYSYDKIKKITGMEPRIPDSELNANHFDLAADVQNHFERQYLNLVKHWVLRTGNKNVCLVGGCALNAKGNQLIAGLDINKMYVMPAASDRGVSLGAALYASHQLGDSVAGVNSMLLGNSWDSTHIKNELTNNNIKFLELENPYDEVAADLIQGRIVGVMFGRSEFGPRSLGARSILANPSIVGMKNTLNKKIKFREEYRPFAPSILEETLIDSQDIDVTKVDYSSMTVNVNLHKNISKMIPEAIHQDGSARIQSVNSNYPALEQILLSLKKGDAYPAVINTSFNLKGEPIVDSPSDAIRTFYSSGIDSLYLENFKLSKYF